MDRKFFEISLLDNTYPALHGVRVLMMLLAIQMHVSLHLILVRYIGGSDLLIDLMRLSLNCGWQTMDFFFVLSGFLIGRILLKNYEEKKGSWTRFYIRRAFRTIPLYYFSLFLVWAAIQWSPLFSVNGATQINWFVEIFYLSNYFRNSLVLAPWSWSLSMEEHFYLAGPILIYGLFKIKGHKARIFILIALALLALGLRYQKYLSTAETGINIFKDLFIPTHLRFDTFVWGFLAAYLGYYYEKKVRALYQMRTIRIVAWSLVILLAGIFLNKTLNQYPFMYLSYGGPAPDDVFRGTALNSVLYFGFLSGILFMLLIQLMTYTSGAVTRILSHPYFRVVATISYGAYLVHLPLAKAVTHSGMRQFPWLADYPISFWFLSFFATCLASFFLSYVLHLVIEKPVLAIRSKYFA